MNERLRYETKRQGLVVLQLILDVALVVGDTSE